jgi:hypothetical protein
MGAGVGQTTALGCGCANGTKGCCDNIGGTSAHGLTDKLQAARKYDGCSALGCPGQCFYWSQPDLHDFISWTGDSTGGAITNIDIWRADLDGFAGCELSQAICR